MEFVLFANLKLFKKTNSSFSRMRGNYLAIETTIMKVVSFVVGIIGRFFVLFAQFSLTRHTAVDKDRKVHFQTKKLL